MKLVIAVAMLSLGFVLSSSASPPPLHDDPSGDCQRDDKPSYTGAESCKKCHFKQFNAWKKTKMAKAFDALKPGNALENKQKFKLDEKKDYTKDATCVPCHVTGYDKPGGYPAIVEGKAWTADETKRASEMENVQCEACHGPGSLTNAYKKDNEAYAKAELVKRGLIAPDETNCKTCHNEKSPTITKDTKFDYAGAIKDPEKIHAHVALKQKH